MVQVTIPVSWIESCCRASIIVNSNSVPTCSQHPMESASPWRYGWENKGLFPFRFTNARFAHTAVFIKEEKQSRKKSNGLRPGF